MKRIAIVGAGLSGLILALNICENSDAKIVIFEKGKRYNDRTLKIEEDLVSGVGGAGTIAGGKLCFPPASAGVWQRSGLDTVHFKKFEHLCLRPFLKDKILPSIKSFNTLLLSKNGLSNKNYVSCLLKQSEMKLFISNILSRIENNGVKIIHNCEFLNYEKTNQKFTVTYSHNTAKKETDEFDYLILAGGRLSAHSMNKWIKIDNSITKQNPDMGIRLSLNYDETNVFKNIGQDIKLKAQFGSVGVRTFCVCSGGSKARVRLNKMQYYDGHFENEISKDVNIGILARSLKIYGYKSAEAYCKLLQPYLDEDLSLKDFISHGSKFVKNSPIFSEIINGIQHFTHKLQKEHILSQNLDIYPVWLPSVDRLNPIIKTDENFETDEKGLYVIGDALGISRGFIQSMWTGYHASKHIIMELESSMTRIRMVG